MNRAKIGILGEMRSGKDTVSKIISRELYLATGKETKAHAFSKGIHDVINLTMPYLYDKGKPRNALQKVGQYMRQIQPDVWIDYLFNHSDFIEDNLLNNNIIITDVRQTNEVKRLQQEGYKIIKVVADDEIRKRRVLLSGDVYKPDMFNHETEVNVHQSPYDYLIDNSGTLDELQERVQEVIKGVMTNEK